MPFDTNAEVNGGASAPKISPNMHLTITIRLLESLTGFTRLVTLKHLGGRKLRIQKYNVTRHDSYDVYPDMGRLKEVGPDEFDTGERGDLIVTYHVKFPQTLTSQQKQRLNEVL